MERLKEQLIKHFQFTEEDWENTAPCLNDISLKSKELFLEKGKVSDRIGIVKSGLLRSYFFNENGDEITTQFFTLGTLVISNVSFNKQIPSKENIVAIEPSELLVFTYSDIQELLQKVPAWQKVPTKYSETSLTSLLDKCLISTAIFSNSDPIRAICEIYLA